MPPDDDEETTPLLECSPHVVSVQSANHPNSVPQPKFLVKSDSGRLETSGAVQQNLKNIGQCKICLEEDAVLNLTEPCGCSGTQKFAHKACIQRWIEEKRSLQCEICSQPYKGDYVLPPPKPDRQDGPVVSMTILRVEQGAYEAHEVDLMHEEDGMQPRPCFRLCFTVVVTIMFLTLLHNTMMYSHDPNDLPDPPESHPSLPPDHAPQTVGEVVASLMLFLLWVLTKVFLIGIPLYTVLRIASRQRQEEFDNWDTTPSPEVSHAHSAVHIRVNDVNGNTRAPTRETREALHSDAV